MNQFSAFTRTAENRTADVVSSIQVLATQYLCYTHLSEEERAVVVVDPQAAQEEVKIDNSAIGTFNRFAVEEVLRRSIKRDTPAFG